MFELCERLDGLIQYDTEFYEMNGKRNIITILTDGEKDPLVMGFKLVDAESLKRFQFRLMKAMLTFKMRLKQLVKLQVLRSLRDRLQPSHLQKKKQCQWKCFET